MLLKYHEDTLKNAYKHLELYTDLALLDAKNDRTREKQHEPIRALFKPCVSFNTVPSFMENSDGADGDGGLDFPGVQFPPEYTMEEYYDDESGFVSDNAGYFLHNNYVTDRRSRGVSPPPRSLQSKKAMLSSMFKIAENGKIVRVDYPSKPTILNDAMIINRAKAGWDRMWIERRDKINERVNNKTEYFKYPKILFPQQPALKTSFISDDGYTPMPKEQRRKEKILHEKLGNPNTPRTILCHISGRRHTWVALDWTLRELAQDTDHVIVLANLPRFSQVEGQGRRSSITCAGSRDLECDNKPRSLSVDASVRKNDKRKQGCIEWTSGYHQDIIVKKLTNILSYIALIIPKDIAIKVSVEIVIGKTQKIMIDAFNVYTPDLCVSSTLKWQRTDNLVLWKSKTLTDTLCTRFPPPVFVAPARRMWETEARLQKAFELKSANASGTSLLSLVESSNSKHVAKSRDRNFTFGNFDYPSIDSLTSSNACQDSVSESEASGSESDSGESVISARERIVMVSRKHRQAVLRALDDIESDKEISRTEKLAKRLDYILKESLSFSSKIENISKSYPGEESGLDHLTRVITGGTEVVPNSKKSMLDVGDVPKNSFIKTSAAKPRKGAIKFASTVNSKDGHRALGKSKLKTRELDRSAIRSLSPVRHSVSINVANVSNEAQSSSTIRRVRSSNSLQSTKSNDSVVSNGSAKKKSGGGFLSIFRSGGRSRSTSRRNSSGSDSDRASLVSDSSKKRRSRLFGFS